MIRLSGSHYRTASLSGALVVLVWRGRWWTRAGTWDAGRILSGLFGRVVR